MQYSILGSTGISVSRIALGTATFGVAPLRSTPIGSSAKRSTLASTSLTPPTCTEICQSSTGQVLLPPPTGNPPSSSLVEHSVVAATRW